MTQGLVRAVIALAVLCGILAVSVGVAPDSAAATSRVDENFGVVPSAQQPPTESEQTNSSNETTEPPNRPDEAKNQTTNTGDDNLRHANPSSYVDEDDLENAQYLLETHLGDRLDRSAIELQEGQYELAREILGTDFTRTQQLYVSVVGNRNGSRSSFDDIRNDQLVYITLVKEYRDTKEKYERARQRGDTQAVNENVVELRNLSRRIDERESVLSENYETVSEDTSTDLSRPASIVQALTRDIVEEQRAIEDNVFTRTNLSTEVASKRVSFTEPIRISGHLTDTNGSGLSNQTLVVYADQAITTTQTNHNGSFSVVHRPVRLPVGEQELIVRYQPALNTEYATTEQNLSVVVAPVTPKIEVENPNRRMRFGDSFGTTGNVTVDGAPVSGVPVALTVGDTELGVSTTDANGTFSIQIPFPHRTQTGQQTLFATIDFGNRAISMTNESVSLLVDRSASSLLLETTVTPDERLVVSGSLRANGKGVPRQALRVYMGGVDLGVVRTNQDGEFNSSVPIPDESVPSVFDSTTVTVRTVFTGDGTNLAPSNASSTVTMSPRGGVVTDILTILPVPEPLREPGILFVTLLGIGVLLFVLSDRLKSEVEEARGRTTTHLSQRENQSDGDDGTPPLERSLQKLDDGFTDEAVAIAYSHARERVANRFTLDSWQTHWEFLMAAERASVPEELQESLLSATSVFDRAVYGPLSVSRAEATEVLRLVEEIEERGFESTTG